MCQMDQWNICMRYLFKQKEKKEEHDAIDKGNSFIYQQSFKCSMVKQKT